MAPNKPLAALFCTIAILLGGVALCFCIGFFCGFPVPVGVTPMFFAGTFGSAIGGCAVGIVEVIVCQKIWRYIAH